MSGGIALAAIPRIATATIEFFSTKLGQAILAVAIAAAAISYAHHSGYSSGESAGRSSQKAICDKTIAAMIAENKAANDATRRQYEIILSNNEAARRRADEEAAGIAAAAESDARAVAEYTRYRMSQTDAAACKLTKTDIEFITKE